jgi:hypothetical protein
MATPTTVQRAPETGDDFRTLETGGVKSQGVAITGNSGEHIGISSDPLVVRQVFEAYARFQSSGFVDSLANVKSGTGGQIRQLRGILDSSVTTQRYLMAFDSLTLPANGTAPDWLMLLPVQGEASETFIFAEMLFLTGITFAVSSTPATLTVTTASEALIFGVVV